MLYQSFTIHPVGQGLFYSCKIENEQKVVFRMIFDCGSKTKGAGQAEVAEYRADSDYLKEKIMDLLIISHFDADHVNHLKRLLEGGVKIRRLVMPFISFEERLYLVLQYVKEQRDDDEDRDTTIRLILDPLSALAENFGDDFEGYIVQISPDDPIPPEQVSEENQSNRDETRWTFNFPAKDKQPLANGQGLKIPVEVGGRVYSVNDTAKGRVNAPDSYLKLMDFLFYRKSIPDRETAFYDEVKKLFLKTFKIDASLEEAALMEEVCEKVKTIQSATRIKKIFKEAAKTVKASGGTGVDLVNPNTTALCVLHRNLEGLYEYASGGNHDFIDHPRLYRRQKFLAGEPSRVKLADYSSHLFYEWDGYFQLNRHTSFPNTLLTSDCFLLTEDDVKAFLNKYKHYLGNFWLFQIPHHGSEKNSNAILHSQIPSSSRCFINYGTQNRVKHPSASVIRSIVTAGSSPTLIPVNEYQGFEFDYMIRKRF